MSFDPSTLQPHYNTWYEKEIVYEGEGYLELGNPKGWVKGKTVATFDELGNYSIKLEVETFECQEDIGDPDLESYKLKWLLDGVRPSKFAGGVAFSDISFDPINHVRKFIIHSSSGVLTAIGEVNYSVSIASLNAENTLIYIFCSHLRFEAFNIMVPRYWSMPLINYLSDYLYMQINSDINYHPMRMLTPGELPELNQSFSQNHEIFLISHIRRCSVFMSFHFSNGNIGLLEKTVKYEDYRTLERNFKSHKLNHAVTSVISGDFSSDESTLDNIPLDVTFLLSLSSGSHVGYPWVDIRDENTNLIVREHIRQSPLRFSKAKSLLDSQTKGGLPELLNNAQFPLSPYTRTAIHLLITAVDDSRMVSDRLSDLFRALDTLRKELFDEIDEEQRAKKQLPKPFSYRKIRQTDRDMLLNTLNQIKDNYPEPTANDYFSKIIENLPSFLDPNKLKNQRSEKDQIARLFEHFNIKDAKILDTYLFSHRVRECESFFELYSTYRNQVIHEGTIIYDQNLTISAEDDETKWEFVFLFHLTDIVIRILLKKLNYSGEYHSWTLRHRGHRMRLDVRKRNVDWVTEITHPSLLGYVDYGD